MLAVKFISEQSDMCVCVCVCACVCVVCVCAAWQNGRLKSLEDGILRAHMLSTECVEVCLHVVYFWKGQQLLTVLHLTHHCTLASAGGMEKSELVRNESDESL